MHDPMLKEEMETFFLALQKILRDDQLTIPSNNYDLVLDIEPKNQTIQWSYYYACHESRCLFWLSPYDGTNMLSEVYGVDCPAHISASWLSVSFSLIPLIQCAEHRLEDLYWYINSLLLDRLPKY